MALAAAGLLAAVGASAQTTRTPYGPVPYDANYEVRYKGKRVARAEFSIVAEADGRFAFVSSTEARGLLKLVTPGPTVDRSEFRLDAAGRIEPIRFEYDDGSRKGDDSFVVDFDETAREVRISGAGDPKTLPFGDGLLDRGSLQVALMQSLSDCRLPRSMSYVDDDGISTYDYDRLDDETVDTGIGSFETVRLAQQAKGSSRRTVLSFASRLRYLLVRIEQFRNDELETVFSLDELEGIEPGPPACSGFR